MNPEDKADFAPTVPFDCLAQIYTSFCSNPKEVVHLVLQVLKD
jgi:hypothetical protein